MDKATRDLLAVIEHLDKTIHGDPYCLAYIRDEVKAWREAGCPKSEDLTTDPADKRASTL